MNNYDNIPAELRQLDQWIMWRYEEVNGKQTKVPYQTNGRKANVNDEKTWCSFETSVQIFNNRANDNDFSGIGFVFSVSDDYTFIDLDHTEDKNTLASQIKIYNEFDTYAEVSPSGKGLHIIVKGVVPSGRRRNNVEIYSSQRYATMTGNLYNDKPIKDCQAALTSLWEQMGDVQQNVNIDNINKEEKLSDEQIIEQAKSAVNGDKFSVLFAGEWKGIYPSQSEADYAFIDMVAFYTQNENQIRRIFRTSSLGKRDKAKRQDYVNGMINKSFDRQVAPIDVSGFKEALENKVAAKQPQSSQSTEYINGYNLSKSPIQIPPGLLGELAQFVYQAAPRPVPEIALAAAIGLMAGVCGRAYNISGTGLNQYVLMLAATGSGKEAAASGIDKLMNAVRFYVPTSVGFIGPSEIASGQALIKHLSKTSQCFVSLLGEFGLRLEVMSSNSANSSEKALKRMLLDLYNKSGKGQVFRPSIYSDSDKNIAATESPAFSILGESTPERFYNALNEEMISEGLLPRFMLIEYNGPRPPLSAHFSQTYPTNQLLEQLSALVANVEIIMHNKNVININCNPEAQAMFDSFDKYADKQINETSKEVLRQLWNRAHIKSLKLAGLIAVGVNIAEPLILPDYVQWAIDMVQNDIRALSAKFEAGEIGVNHSENRQLIELKRIIKEYFFLPIGKLETYRIKRDLFDQRIIPWGYLSRRLITLSAFNGKQEKYRGTEAIKHAVNTLIDNNELRECNNIPVKSNFGGKEVAFYVIDTRLLD